MKNYICTGERLDVAAPSGGLTSGQVYIVGSKATVVVSGGAEGVLCSVMTEGVFELAKAVGAITIGQRLFWDSTNSCLTTTAAGNTYVGYAFKASLSADTTGFVTMVDNTGGSQAAVQADSTAANVAAMVIDFNALLAKLKSAGLMASA